MERNWVTLITTVISKEDLPSWDEDDADFTSSIREYVGQGGTWKGIDGRDDPTLEGGDMLVSAYLTQEEYDNVIEDPRNDVFLGKAQNYQQQIQITIKLNQLSVTELQILRDNLERHHIPIKGLKQDDDMKRVMKFAFYRYWLRRRLNETLLGKLDFKEVLTTKINQIPNPKRGKISQRLIQLGFDLTQINGNMTVEQTLTILFEQMESGVVPVKTFWD